MSASFRIGLLRRIQPDECFGRKTSQLLGRARSPAVARESFGTLVSQERRATYERRKNESKMRTSAMIDRYIPTSVMIVRADMSASGI